MSALARNILDLAARLSGSLSGRSRLVFGLETPKPHRLKIGEPNSFSGWVFFHGGRTVRQIVFRADKEPTVVAAVELARPDIQAVVPQVEAAANCGFAATVPIGEGAERLHAGVVFEDGGTKGLFDYDLAAVRREADELSSWSKRLDALVVPDSELVFATQGMSDSFQYKESSIPGVRTIQSYLRHAGVAPETLSSMLDFGCGTGRLLVGWWAAGWSGPLAGCDVNSELIGWVQRHLPTEMRFDATAYRPPLPYGDASFDLVTAVSVFTHLGWASEEEWARELSRVLRPDGVLLLTLHGETYVHHTWSSDPQAVREFRRKGFLTFGGAETSNQFASFHTRRAVRRLFREFSIRAFFPNGRVRGCGVPFPVAAHQDVYVLRRLR